MEKLADISAFESLSGNSSVVFNGAWNYNPETVGATRKRCEKIRHYANILLSLSNK